MLLWGEGALLPGTPIQVGLVGGEPAARVFLVIGGAAAYTPFRGLTIVPRRDMVLQGGTDGAGSYTLSTSWPAHVPPAAQFWVQGFVLGSRLAGSNALHITTP
jgi:hypothetical protein